MKCISNCMNRIVFLIVSLFLLASCASEYQINGNSTVSRLDGKMLFIKVLKNNEMVKVDSAEVVHGLFSMNGPVDSVYMASLYMDEQNIMPFVIEDGDIQMNIEAARITVSGTPLNDRLYEFIRKKSSLDDRAYEVERMESRMIMDGMSEEEIQMQIKKERETLTNEMNALAKEFVQANYENVLGPGVFIMLCNSFPYPVITPIVEEIVNEAPQSFQNHPMVVEYMKVARENMEKLKEQK